MIALEDSQLAAPDASTEAAQSLSCSVKLSSFEGPLDLLLHLIRANEVDIGDIPIAPISQQYLEYLEMMELLDIDIASLPIAFSPHHRSERLAATRTAAELLEGNRQKLEDLAAALLEHEILDDLEIDQILEGRKLNKPLSTGDRVDAVSAANAVAVSPASIIDEGTEPRE